VTIQDVAGADLEVGGGPDPSDPESVEARPRRTAAGIPPQDVGGPLAALGEARFNLLEETILPSLKSIELRRSPTVQCVNRFMTRTPDIAELFHANSAISTCSDASIFLDPEALVAAQEWFFFTAYDPRPESINVEGSRACEVMIEWDTIPEALAPLARLREPDISPLAFALDLFVVWKGHLYRLFPERKALWLDRTLSATDVISLNTGLGGDQGGLRWRTDEERPLLVIVCAAWRYMLLQGPRGYRRALLDAGKLLHLLEDESQRRLTPIETSYDFFDSKVNRALGLDGAERATLAVAAFGPANIRAAAQESVDD